MLLKTEKGIKFPIAYQVLRKEHLIGVFVVIHVLCAGCRPEPYLHRIEERSPKPAEYDVYKLGDYPSSEAAREVILRSLRSDDPDVRCAAVVALRSHLSEVGHARRLSILEELLPLLEDDRFGQMSQPAISPLIPAGVHVRQRSVRVEALYTISYWTQQDHGFDKVVWSEALQELKHPAEGGR